MIGGVTVACVGTTKPGKTDVRPRFARDKGGAMAKSQTCNCGLVVSFVAGNSSAELAGVVGCYSVTSIITFITKLPLLSNCMVQKQHFPKI